MLKFSTTIDEIIDQQATSRSTVKQFTVYSSKKRLFESGILDEKVATYIKDLKGAFGFHVHKDRRYMVIEMWYNATRSYGFYVLDTQTLQIARAESVKMAKQGIMELVAQNDKATDKGNK